MYIQLVWKERSSNGSEWIRMDGHEERMVPQGHVLSLQRNDCIAPVAYIYLVGKST